MLSPAIRRCRSLVAVLVCAGALSLATPLTAQQTDSARTRNTGPVRYLMEGLKAEGDLAGETPMLAWLRLTSAAPIIGSLLGEGLASGGAPRHGAVSQALVHQRTAGDSVFLAVTIDSVPIQVNDRWRFEAAPPAKLLTSTWNRTGALLLHPYRLDQLLGSDSLRQPPAAILPQLDFPTFVLPLVVPPSLEGKSASMVWADTSDFAMEHHNPNGGPIQESVRAITTWRMLSADTLAIEQELVSTMTLASHDNSSMVVSSRDELVALVALDGNREIRSGLVANRSTSTTTFDPPIVMPPDTPALDLGGKVSATRIGRLTRIRMP